MTRPLIEDKRQKNDAAKFHRAVFRAHGNRCWNCDGHATDAAHVIPRAQLGSLRYEIPVENGRPACRRCHNAQESGEIAFPVEIVRIAIRAHNQISKVHIQEPT